MRRILSLLFIIAVALCWVTTVSAADMHQGKVVEINAGKLTMTDMAGKNQHTHDISSDTPVSRDDKSATLTDLKVGDTVTVTMEGEKPAVTKVEAKPASSS
jgi:flagellar basal body L-ring protein FlgH